MNEISAQYNQLINSTIDYCNIMLDNLKEIAAYIEIQNKNIEIGVYVDTLSVNKKQEEARIIRKRIFENMATIGLYSGKIELEQSDFNGYQDKVMRSATFISSSLLDMITNEVQINQGVPLNNVSVSFRNTGYKEWNSTNIMLIISIYNEEMLINVTSQASLPADKTVPTGDIAEFQIDNVTVPNTQSVCTVKISITDPNDSYIYNETEKYGLNIKE